MLEAGDPSSTTSSALEENRQASQRAAGAGGRLSIHSPPSKTSFCLGVMFSKPKAKSVMYLQTPLIHCRLSASVCCHHRTRKRKHGS